MFALVVCSLSQDCDILHIRLFSQRDCTHREGEFWIRKKISLLANLNTVLLFINRRNMDTNRDISC